MCCLQPQNTLADTVLDKCFLSCTGGTYMNLHLVSQDQTLPIGHLISGEGKGLIELCPETKKMAFDRKWVLCKILSSLLVRDIRFVVLIFCDFG